MINLKSIIPVLLLLSQSQQLVAQSDVQKLTAEEIAVTIDSINNKLHKNYVFPEVAGKMGELLKKNLKEGKYNLLLSPNELTRQLTNDLQSVSKDKHLMVNYNPSIIAREKALTDADRANEEAEWAKELAQNLKRDNYGFKEIKILDGNIGYLDLREFVDPKYGSETLTAAMHFLVNTKAMIIDLRQNDGGHPEMVQLLASYFFSSQRVHLADHYNRPKNELTQSWTLPTIPGTRRPEVDLYILTSSKTFSAAEAFSYQSVIATDKFYLRIPQGRTTSPVTKSNWEGVGVTPDLEVTAELALQTALTKALEKVKGN
jgi:retinol-binding protein 3